MPQAPRPTPSFGVTRRNVPGVLARANLMYTAFLAAVAMFVSPPIAMADFLLVLQAAAAAEAATLHRTRGLAAARDVKVDALWAAMKTLKTYVDGLCVTVDATTAMSMIEAAGLLVSKYTLPAKPLLSATYVGATGMVHLVVHAQALIGKRPTKKTTFTWSWSTDGGASWSSGVTTGYAHVDVPDLPPGSYLFRVFATVGKVPGEPTAPVPLTIHAS